jgi:hypothetical protein
MNTGWGCTYGGIAPSPTTKIGPVPEINKHYKSTKALPFHQITDQAVRIPFRQVGGNNRNKCPREYLFFQYLALTLITCYQLWIPSRPIALKST